MGSRWRLLRHLNYDGCFSSQWCMDTDESSGFLGQGGYGTVRVATSKGIGVTPKELSRAVKLIGKKKTKLSAIHMEVDFLAAFDHPNICKLYETFDQGDHFCLVMENLSGGTLQEYVETYLSVAEEEAAVAMRQVLQAVRALQAMQISHNDLLARNVMLQRRGRIKGNTLKVVDFGAATFEAQKGELWSCGCLMHYIVSGEQRKACTTKIKIGDVMLKDVGWETISENGKNFAGMLFKKNAAARCTAQQALDHVWVRRPEHEFNSELVEMVRKVPGALERYEQHNALKRAALLIIADQLDGSSNLKLQSDVFEELDVDGDGMLTMQELMLGLARAQVEPPQNLQELMEAVDVSGVGVLDRATFLAANMEEDVYDNKELCRAAFSAFNTCGQHGCSARELQSILRCSAIEADMIVQQVSKTGDGFIHSDDFAAVLQRSMKSKAGVGLMRAVCKFEGMIDRATSRKISICSDDPAKYSICSPSSGPSFRPSLRPTFLQQREDAPPVPQLQSERAPVSSRNSPPLLPKAAGESTPRARGAKAFARPNARLQEATQPESPRTPARQSRLQAAQAHLRGSVAPAETHLDDVTPRRSTRELLRNISKGNANPKRVPSVACQAARSKGRESTVSTDSATHVAIVARPTACDWWAVWRRLKLSAASAEVGNSGGTHDGNKAGDGSEVGETEQGDTSESENEDSDNDEDEVDIEDWDSPPGGQWSCPRCGSRNQPGFFRCKQCPYGLNPSWA